MKFDIPKALFCGLALIAAAIFLGRGQFRRRRIQITTAPYLAKHTG